MTEEFTKQRISQSKGPTLKFDGRLLASSTDNPRGEKTRWIDNELWETPVGAWIAVFYGRNDDKDQDFVKAAVIEPRPSEWERIMEVMTFLEWTKVARALAKQMGWSLNLEIE